MNPPGLFSIGHSNHSLEVFLSLLKQHEIEALVDVRSQPYSRYSSQFDKERLQPAVTADKIRYLFLGKELGGRPSAEEFYDAEGHVLYARLAKSPSLQRGLERLEQETRNARVVLMCSEEDPAVCHRHLLLGRLLAERGVSLVHIRGDGRIQTHDELMSQENREAQLSLFDAPEGTTWRSIRSVLPRNPPRTSSED